MSMFRLDDPNLTKNQRAMVERRHRPAEFYESWIGKKVSKKFSNTSLPKKFKSNRRLNTVKGIVLDVNATERTGAPVYAFTFEEDDSTVGCHICRLIDLNGPEVERWLKHDLKVLRRKAMGLDQ